MTKINYDFSKNSNTAQWGYWDKVKAKNIDKTRARTSGNLAISHSSSGNIFIIDSIQEYVFNPILIQPIGIQITNIGISEPFKIQAK